MPGAGGHLDHVLSLAGLDGVAGALLLAGLVCGVTHCADMCGPFALWAGLVVAFSVAGLALFYVGLVITLPFVSPFSGPRSGFPIAARAPFF